jgi:hypothetical protein
MILSYEEAKELMLEENKLQYLSDMLENYANSNLSSAQFMYLSFLYTRRYDLLLRYHYEYFDKVRQFPFNKDEINELYHRGLITEQWKSGDPDNPALTAEGSKLMDNLLKVNPRTITIISEKKESMGKELIEEYPDYFYANHQAYPTKGFRKTKTHNGKFIEGRYDLINYYYEIIEGNQELHESILEKIRYAKRQNGVDNRGNNVPQIRQTIMNFVINKDWEYIKVIGNNTNIKIG